MQLSEKLVKLRKAKGISQLELAEKMDVSRQAVSRWETGAALPSTDNLGYLGKLYDVPLEYLLYDDAPEPSCVEQAASGSKTKKIVVLSLCGVIPLLTLLVSLQLDTAQMYYTGQQTLLYIYGFVMRPLAWLCVGVAAGFLFVKENGSRYFYWTMLLLGLILAIAYGAMTVLHFCGIPIWMKLFMWVTEKAAVFLIPGIMIGIGIKGKKL